MIRVVPQEGREASILSIAVNGAMAGCRPEYMPLLVAVVEAMCDPGVGDRTTGAMLPPPSKSRAAALPS